MTCPYKKYPECITTNCKWYVKDRCIIEFIEEKLESQQAIDDMKSAIEIDNKPAINNCPYCTTVLSGHTNIFKRSMGGEDYVYQVFCNNCQLRGPQGTTAQEAITQYNSLPTGNIGEGL